MGSTIHYVKNHRVLSRPTECESYVHVPQPQTKFFRVILSTMFNVCVSVCMRCM